MRTILIALSAAFISQAAWASPPDFPNHGKPTFGAHVSNPCGAQQHGPRADIGRQALVNNCNQLHMKLQASPNDADLQGRCDRAAKALSGRLCGPGRTAYKSAG